MEGSSIFFYSYRFMFLFPWHWQNFPRLKINLKALGLWFCFVFFSGCNYNYWLGKNLEEQKRYEEAYEKYQAAYVSSPSNEKYKAARDRTAISTAQDLAERYFSALQKNDFYNAYFFLNRSLSLDPNNISMRLEEANWFQVLILGQFQVNQEDLKKKVMQSGEISLSADFYSSKIDQILRADIDHVTGVFFLEDVLYKPVFSLLSFYSLQSVGLRYKPINSQLYVAPKKNDANTSQSGLNKPDEFIAESYQAFVDLKNSRVEETKGELLWEKKDHNEKKVTDYATQIPQLYPQLFQGGNWLPSAGVRYRTALALKKISVTTSEKSIPFLPLAWYINKTDRRILLDFGILSLNYSLQTGFWGMKRIADTPLSLERFKITEKNLVYSTYQKYDGSAFVLEKD